MQQNNKKMNKVYAFNYNPDVNESVWATVSLHATKKGAEMAMEFHKNERLKEWKELYGNEETVFEFGDFQDWCIEEYNILP